jgi:hypothetical protein
MKSTSPRSALLLPLILASLALVTSAQAGTQWKWKDASGAVQYSDRPPPAGTPEASILQRPSGARAVPAPKPASDADAAASAAKPPAGKASAESELDAKRRKAEEEKEAQRKATEEKNAKIRADNCAQARTYQRTLNDGLRIARTNSKGEREILDDKGRAEEQRRNQEAISSNCK